MKQKDTQTNKGKKSILIKVIIVVLIALISYYVVSEIISGFGAAYTE